MALRIALIGAGRIAARRIGAYAVSDGLRLAAICDPYEPAARALAARAGIAAVHTDPLALLADSAIDAVDICTPHDIHAPLAIAAAQAGKHILLQKPLACTMDDCHAAVATAEAAGVTLMLAMNQRFKPNYNAVRLAIGRGELGAIRRAQFSSILSLPAAVPRDHWVFDPRRSGGGVIMSLGVQCVDLMRHLLGDVDRLLWSRGATLDSRFSLGVETRASAAIRFDSGATAEIFLSFAPSEPTAQRFSIHGERAMVAAEEATAKTNEPAVMTSGGSNLPLSCEKSDLRSDDMFVNELAHFADCCRTGRQPITSGRDALKTMETVFAMRAGLA